MKRMERLILLIEVIVVLTSVGAIVIASSNYRRLREAYRAAITWLEYCGSFIRTEESLLRKNKGDAPDNITDNIAYVDYIGDMDFIFEGANE